MSKDICTINIPKGWLGNDYTFYDDGSIKPFYDAHETRPNITEHISADQISDHKKKKLIENCFENYKEQITEILFGE